MLTLSQFLPVLASASSHTLSAAHFSPASQSVDRKSTRLNSSHLVISYAVFCLKKKNAIQCNDTKPPENPNRPTFTAEPPMTVDKAKKYTATIDTSCGKITVDLDAKGAPHSVNNFVFLADKHFYDGLTWHRVVKDFVIQGGDPQGNGSGGPGHEVGGELPQDGYKPRPPALANPRPHNHRPPLFLRDRPERHNP